MFMSLPALSDILPGLQICPAAFVSHGIDKGFFGNADHRDDKCGGQDQKSSYLADDSPAGTGQNAPQDAAGTPAPVKLGYASGILERFPEEQMDDPGD